MPWQQVAPFPASDLWGSVAVRTELLRSLLNADLLGLLLLDPLRSSSHPLLTSRGRSVGFLLFEYTRNFLSCCKRMLGLEYEFHKGGYLGVEYEGRHVMLQVATFGISPTSSRRLSPSRATPLLPHTSSSRP